MIDAKTKICCIIGNPVEHSLSPQMHNAAFNKLGLNSVFVAIKVFNLQEAVRALKQLNFSAIVVTVPHKQEVMNYVDEIDPTAQKIGAVNIILNKHGILWATNTDWSGAMDSLKEKTIISGKTVAVIGAGGAARAVVYGLKQEKARVWIFNRTEKKAVELAKEFDLDKAFKLNETAKISEAEVIINTTSVGMEPGIGISPIPADIIRSNQTVFDIVYTPHKTKFLKSAKQRGANVVYGYKMVLYGGTRIFELMTDKKAPAKIMEKALKDNLL